MSIIEEFWETFVEMSMKNASEQQLKYVRRIFFAGAMTTIVAQKENSEKYKQSLENCIILKIIENEIVSEVIASNNFGLSSLVDKELDNLFGS